MGEKLVNWLVLKCGEEDYVLDNFMIVQILVKLGDYLGWGYQL